ncbi:MAG: hypothetical protein E5V35_29075, partial [Mesorhizobium sp.]
VACLGADQRRILNIGGSKTALLHHGGAANEVSMGSAFSDALTRAFVGPPNRPGMCGACAS